MLNATYRRSEQAQHFLLQVQGLRFAVLFRLSDRGAPREDVGKRRATVFDESREHLPP